MEKKYADLLINRGSLRIGTLYEFRNEEKHGKAIGDKQEGKKSTYMVIDRETWTEQNTPEFIKPIFKVGKGATVNISGGTFERPQESSDLYIFCTTSTYDVSAMRDFGYDTCVVIEKPDRFFNALSKKLKHRGVYQGSHPCRYQQRRMPYQLDAGFHPALIKEPKHAYQKEIRSVWVPNKTIIQPIIVQSFDLTKYCYIKRDG